MQPPNADISHSPRASRPTRPSCLGSLRSPLTTSPSPHCHHRRHQGRVPPLDRPTCSSGLNPPQSLGRPYCSRPSHPPSSAQGHATERASAASRPPVVRRPCVLGRLSRPKLRSTAIVGGRQACRRGREPPHAPTATPGLQGLRIFLSEGCPPPPAPLASSIRLFLSSVPPSPPAPLGGFAPEQYQDLGLFQTEGNQAAGLGGNLGHRPHRRPSVE